MVNHYVKLPEGKPRPQLGRWISLASPATTSIGTRGTLGSRKTAAPRERGSSWSNLGAVGGMVGVWVNTLGTLWIPLVN